MYFNVNDSTGAQPLHNKLMFSHDGEVALTLQYTLLSAPNFTWLQRHTPQTGSAGGKCDGHPRRAPGAGVRGGAHARPTLLAALIRA